MKKLLTVTAIFEGLTGLGLITMPSFLASILLGASITENVAIIVAMVAGAALTSIATGCWLERQNAKATAIIKSLLVYNITTTAIFIYGAVAFQLNGIGLWPAAIAHLTLAVWCVVLIQKKTA